MKDFLIVFGIKFAIIFGLAYFLVDALGQGNLAWHETLVISAVLGFLVALVSSLGRFTAFVASWRAGVIDPKADERERR